MMNKLLIGSPIKQKPSILNEFLKSLLELDLQGIDVHYYFIDDNTDEESSKLLCEFQNTNKNVLLRKNSEFGYELNQKYDCNEKTHVWKKDLIHRIITFKNDIISYAQRNEFDYLFFVDSDIVLNPCTIKHLITKEVDIVSNVFWTRWNVGGFLFPQVWMQDVSNYHVHDWDKQYTNKEIDQLMLDFINQMKIPGLYKVGGLGACTLMNKKSIQSGVNFSLIDNVSFWGEDRHFCIRARVLGLGLYVDTTYPAYHIYRENYLSGVENFKKNGFSFEFAYKAEEFNSGESTVKRDSMLNKISERVKPVWNNLCTKAVKKIYRGKRVVLDHHTITASIIFDNNNTDLIKNQIEQAKQYASNFVIVNTIKDEKLTQLCEQLLAGIPYKIIFCDTADRSNVRNRKDYWNEILKMNPDWIINLGSGEVLSDIKFNLLESLVNNSDIDLYCIGEERTPFLLRFQPNFKYKFDKEIPFKLNMPDNIYELDYANINID